jgi:hypothetical protein
MKDGLLTALERPSAELLATVRKYEGQSFIGRFLTFRRERMGRGEWPVDPAQRRDMISAWLEETFEADVRRVAIKMEQESIEHWHKSVAQNCNYLGVAGRNGRGPCGAQQRGRAGPYPPGQSRRSVGP